MIPIRIALAMGAIAVSLTGCYDQTLTTHLPGASLGGESGSGSLTASPASVLITGIGAQADSDLSDFNDTSSVTITGCGGIATATSYSSVTAMVITSVAVGTCSLHVTDSKGNAADVQVTVNSLTVPVN